MNSRSPSRPVRLELLGLFVLALLDVVLLLPRLALQIVVAPKRRRTMAALLKNQQQNRQSALAPSRSEAEPSR